MGDSYWEHGVISVALDSQQNVGNSQGKSYSPLGAYSFKNSLLWE